MAGLKIAREAGQHEPDNLDDAIGYLSMMGEVRGGVQFEGLVTAAPLEGEAMMKYRGQADRMSPGNSQTYTGPDYARRSD